MILKKKDNTQSLENPDKKKKHPCHLYGVGITVHSWSPVTYVYDIVFVKFAKTQQEKAPTQKQHIIQHCDNTTVHNTTVQCIPLC